MFLANQQPPHYHLAVMLVLIATMSSLDNHQRHIVRWQRSTFLTMTKGIHRLAGQNANHFRDQSVVDEMMSELWSSMSIKGLGLVEMFSTAWERGGTT